MIKVVFGRTPKQTWSSHKLKDFFLCVNLLVSCIFDARSPSTDATRNTIVVLRSGSKEESEDDIINYEMIDLCYMRSHDSINWKKRILSMLNDFIR